MRCGCTTQSTKPTTKPSLSLPAAGREVTKHQHKRALALTARKLVRLVYALLKKGQLYRANYQQEA